MTRSNTKNRTARTKKSVAVSKPISSEKVYAEFVSGLQVYAIWLKNCACSVERDAFLDLENGLNTFKQVYRLLNLEGDHFDGEGSYQVNISPGEDSDALVTIECSFVAHIHSAKQIVEEHARRFSQSELTLILTPYARHFVTTVTSQMSIPPVILPLSKRKRD